LESVIVPINANKVKSLTNQIGLSHRSGQAPGTPVPAARNPLGFFHRKMSVDRFKRMIADFQVG
jgi:hypothetical protein